jgi:hypothetical protein
MAYYTALINAWNSATQPPAGVTGTALTGLTTAQKLIAVNAWTVAGPAQKAIISVNAIINAVTSTDLLALTVTQLQVMTLLLAGGGSVDASPGTTVRAVFQSIFASKTTTLANLTALVAPFDNPMIPWWQATVAQGGGGLSSLVNGNDLVAAGNLT